MHIPGLYRSKFTHMSSLEEREEAQPPFFKTWTPIYSIVIGTLAVLILLFHLFSQAYL